MKTRSAVFEEVAKGLRDWGYPSATAENVRDVYEAMSSGNPIPHGIVGMFAQDNLMNVLDQIRRLEP